MVTSLAGSGFLSRGKLPASLQQPDLVSGWASDGVLRNSTERSQVALGHTPASMRMHNPFGDYKSDDDEVGGWV